MSFNSILQIRDLYFAKKRTANMVRKTPLIKSGPLSHKTGSSAMYHSIKAGKPIEIEEKDSLADALLGGIGTDNQITFSMVRNLVDELILVSEEEIAEGMFFAFDTHHVVIEGAGAVGLSAILSNKLIPALGETAVVLLSGGNVDAGLLAQIASTHYKQKDDNDL